MMEQAQGEEIFDISDDGQFEAFTKAYQELPKDKQQPFGKNKAKSKRRYCAHCGKAETANKDHPVLLTEQETLLLDGRPVGKQLLCGACIAKGQIIGFVPKASLVK